MPALTLVPGLPGGAGACLLALEVSIAALLALAAADVLCVAAAVHRTSRGHPAWATVDA